MKKNKTLFVCSILVFVLTGCSLKNSTLTKVHLTNQKGFTQTLTVKERLKPYNNDTYLKHQPHRKIVRVFEKKGQTKTIITTYHPDGHIFQSLDCINNQACGAYNEWYPSGRLKVSSRVVSGIADIDPLNQSSWVFEGLNMAFDESGSLEACISYHNSELEGVSQTFYENGNLKSTTPYKRNKVDGEAVVYSPTGNLEEKTFFKNGLKEGRATRHWKNKALASEEVYSKGKLNLGIYFNSMSTPISKVSNGQGEKTVFDNDLSYKTLQVQNGKLEGYVKKFDKTGALLSQHLQKEGQKEGLETAFYPNSSQKKIEMHWQKGRAQGLVKTWYEAGGIESQREMSQNKKHGLFTAWYENGNLMFVEEYDHDRLTKGKYYRSGLDDPISTVQDGNGLASFFDLSGNLVKKVEYFGGLSVE